MGAAAAEMLVERLDDLGARRLGLRSSSALAETMMPDRQ
jgi:hypothetical protein